MSIAFRMTKSLRMQAVRATFLAFPHTVRFPREVIGKMLRVVKEKEQAETSHPPS